MLMHKSLNSIVCYTPVQQRVLWILVYQTNCLRQLASTSNMRICAKLKKSFKTQAVLEIQADPHLCRRIKSKVSRLIGPSWWPQSESDLRFFFFFNPFRCRYKSDYTLKFPFHWRISTSTAAVLFFLKQNVWRLDWTHRLTSTCRNASVHVCVCFCMWVTLVSICHSSLKGSSVLTAGGCYGKKNKRSHPEQTGEGRKIKKKYN